MCDTLNGMNTMDWYEKTVGGNSVLRVANRAGLVHSTLNRQLKAGRLAPETLVAVADAYGKDAIDALIIHGLITEDHLRAHLRSVALENLTDREIANEVTRRLAGVEEHEIYDEPVRLNVIPEGIEGMAAHDPGYSPEDEWERRHDT